MTGSSSCVFFCLSDELHFEGRQASSTATTFCLVVFFLQEAAERYLMAENCFTFCKFFILLLPISEFPLLNITLKLGYQKITVSIIINFNEKKLMTINGM